MLGEILQRQEQRRARRS